MKEDAPSATANVVARNVLLVASTKKLSHLVAPSAARLSGRFIQAFSPQGEAFLRRVGRTPFQSLFRFYERITIPGLALHQALRKKHIERVVRASLAEGFNQVVVLGGGLDSLALRLHGEFPRVNFLELDHPATQRVKREVIEAHRLAGDNLKLLAVDFTEQALEDCLAASQNYLPGAKTLFICEGVLMYLEAGEVDEIFAFIRRQPGALKRFVFTFMEPDESGKTNFRNSTWLVRLWLSWRKEPFKWGVSREEVGNFLAARGFSVKELATPETFRDLYLRNPDLSGLTLAEGENVCVCDSEKASEPARRDAEVD
jgi:methyltransferase (TIGR00027 family)